MGGEVFVGSVEDGMEVMGMNFQVAGVKKALAAVSKITNAGNDVHFGKEAKDCYIECRASGKRIQLRKEGNVYIFYALITLGSKKKRVKIVVDSGAAENVMPHGWFPELSTQPAEAGVHFVAADGSPLGNYGRKKITFVAEETSAGFSGRA